MHDAMLSSLKIKVVASRKTPGKKNDPRLNVTNVFQVLSPLAKKPKANTEDKRLHNLNPFWAILRCADAKSCNNMELDRLAFKDLGFSVPGATYGSSQLEFRVEIPILRNVTNIAKGEILTLSFIDQ